MISSLWRKKNSEVLMQLRLDLLVAIEKIRLHFTSLAAMDEGATITVEPRFSRVSTQVAFPLYNGIFLPRMDAETCSEDVEDALRPFKKNKVPAIVCVGSLATPSNLESILIKKSCRLVDVEYDLGIDVQSFKIPSFLFNKVSLKAVSTIQEKQEWVKIFFENFKLPEYAMPHFLKLIQNEGSAEIKAHYFFGCRNKEIIGTVALIQYRNIAGVYCVSIDPEVRKESLGTMMMAAAYRWAQSSGQCRYLVGNSNQAAYKLYSKAPTIVNLGQTKVFQLDA